MQNVEELERQMRAALGIFQKREPAKRDASNPVRGFHVTLSVRKDTGPAFRFDYHSRSLSRTEAILEAEQAAKILNLRPWALLDVVEA